MMDDPGKLLALSAALCWTISTVAFTNAGKRIGSLPVNVIRMVLAIALLTLFEGLTRGQWIPATAGPRAWLWLSLSGFIGFFVGDLFLFKAMTVIGSRLSSLVMSLAPPTAAVVGWLWIGETMELRSLIGMAVTISGVSWVVMEQQSDPNGVTTRPSLSGLLYALVGAMGQGVGVVMAKAAFTPLPGADAEGIPGVMEASLIRALAGTVGFIALISWWRRWPSIFRACRRARPMTITSIGAFAGPFLGVALLMQSIQTIPTGVAQTIVAIVPVLILPFVIVVERERVSGRAAVGALIAVAGVALLFYGNGAAN